MASREKLIFDLLTGKDTLNPRLTKAEKKSASVSSTITKTFTTAFKGIGVVAAGVAAGVAAVGAGFVVSRAIRESRELESALIGLRTVSDNLGQDTNRVTEAAKELASDGLIPLRSVSNSLKNLLATGLSADEAVKTFKALRDSAAFNRQGQLELGDAIQGATEGLKNDLSIKVDNAGVTKNLSIILKEYARDNNTTVAALTEAQRAQAKYLGIVKEAAIFQGDYNRLPQTFSGALDNVGGSFRIFLAELGSFITKSPAVIKLTSTAGEIFKNLTTQLKSNAENIRIFVRDGFASFLGAVPAIIDGARLVANALNFIGRVALFSADNVLQLLGLFAKTDVFETFAKFAVEAFSFVADGFAQLIETVVGTGIGADIAKKLGLDPDKIKDSVSGVRESLLQFAGEFEGGEIGQQLDRASEKVKGAITFSDENIEALNAGFDTAKEVVRNFNEDLAEFDRQRTQAEIDNAKKRKNAKKKNTDEEKKDQEDFYDFSIKREKETGRQRVANLKSTLGTIATLQSQSNKELFFIGKAAAISQATIDGIAAVQKALTAAPPPFNFALAALVGVATAANVASIASAKPPAAQTGGILDPNGSNTTGDFLPFRGNSGEAILTKGQQARFIELADGASPAGGNNEALLEEIRGLRAELTNQPVVVQVDQREIARAVRDEVRSGFAI
jgi:hypothetical protein